jgi:hypothetical protein
MQRAWIIAGLVFSLGLSACGAQWPERDQVVQARMIGLPKIAVRACMGPPASHKGIGTTEIWSYDTGTTQLETQGFATYGHPRHPHCRVNIVMTNGVVSQINYAGLAGDSLDLGERCVFSDARCAGP